MHTIMDFTAGMFAGFIGERTDVLTMVGVLLRSLSSACVSSLSSCI